MNSLMTLGHARPLGAPDLRKLQDHRLSGVIAETNLASFDADRGRRVSRPSDDQASVEFAVHELISVAPFTLGRTF
jgi:hypothetical protein